MGSYLDENWAVFGKLAWAMAPADLKDSVLLERAKLLVEGERRVSTGVLKYLHEIEKRRLFASQGYSSMWEFSTRYLGYSEGAAQRRIAAMRLIRAVPSVEEKIRTGALTLSVAAKAQEFSRAQKQDAEKVVALVEGKSFRDVQEVFFTLAPTALPKERSRLVGLEHTEIRMIVDDSLKAKLDMLREFSHKKTYVELIEALIEREWLRNCTGPRSRATTTSIATPGTPPKLTLRLRREVWLRDKGK